MTPCPQNRCDGSGWRYVSNYRDRVQVMRCSCWLEKHQAATTAPPKKKPRRRRRPIRDMRTRASGLYD